MKFATLAAVFALIICPLIAQAGAPLSREVLETAAALRDRALAGNEAFALVESLTTEVGPRLAGSPGDARAVAWAQAKLAALGFDKVWTEPVSFPYWVRGMAHAEVLAPFPQPLTITALGHSIGTPDEGITAEVVQIADYEALTKADPAAVKGKIVFIANRMARHKTGQGYGAAVVARSKGAAAAARLGAVAVLIRSIGTDTHRLAHTGLMRYEEGTVKIPAAALSNPDADLLSNMVRRGQPVSLRLVMNPRTLGTASSANVIGEIRGSTKPEEIVLLGAHLDSWDLGTGAIDDGAGVAIVTAAALLIGKLPNRPARTIRVVLFANEESGLWGGKAYAQTYSDRTAQHIVAAESDFGAGRVWRFNSRVAEEAYPLIDQITKVLEPLGIEAGDHERAGGPDIGPIVALGVPVVSLYQDGTDYFDYHHTADDTLDKIDPKALDQNVAAYVAFAYLAAQAPDGFGRIPIKEEEH